MFKLLDVAIQQVEKDLSAYIDNEVNIDVNKINLLKGSKAAFEEIKRCLGDKEILNECLEEINGA